MGVENVRSKKNEPAALYDFEKDVERTRETDKKDDYELLHEQLMDWYRTEKDKQAINRLQQQIDCDFYDSLQWSEEEAQEMINRGQQPSVYNEVAPMVDWLLGTERRTRVDYHILPRNEEDFELALTKTKVFKYVTDVNKSVYARSLAFADACKSGIGWLEEGVSTDPTDELIYTRHESWRHMWWDSNAREVDLSDARYVWREKWLDLDVACAIWPEKAGMLSGASIGHEMVANDMDDQYYLGQSLNADSQERFMGFNRYLSTTNASHMGRRDRVKVIEMWYRKPECCQLCRGELFNGREFDKKNPTMMRAYNEGLISVVNHLQMKVYVAFMITDCVLANNPSPYNHNRFPFTPIFAYRRTRDNLPYSPIRRIRDPQESLNKRMSKALYHLSTRQIIADDDATDDWDELVTEAARPDGVIRKKKGSELIIESGNQHAAAHVEYASLDAQHIQRSVGITDENLGRKTNAVSGKAIEARQQQGSVVTTELFDNLRLAYQIQGENLLSLIEQYYTEEKIIRITDERERPEFVQINKQEIDEYGQESIVNDITKSQADFIVSEQDFNGTLRAAMFDSMMNLTQSAQIDPMLSMKLLRMAFEYSDFPNKDQIVSELRKMTGEIDPNEKLNEEEAAAMQAQQEAQQKAQAMAEQMAQLQSEEMAAKVELTRAQAMKLTKEAELAGVEDNSAAIEQQFKADLAKIQQDSAKVLDSVMRENMELERQLAQVAQDFRNKEAEIAGKYNATIEAARISADSQREIAMAKVEAERQKAELEAQSNAKLEKFAAELDKSNSKFAEIEKQMQAMAKEHQKELERLAKEQEKREAQAKKEYEAKEAKEKSESSGAPMTINVQVDAKPESQKSVVFKRDKAGKVTGAEVSAAPEKPKRKPAGDS